MCAKNMLGFWQCKNPIQDLIGCQRPHHFQSCLDCGKMIPLDCTLYGMEEPMFRMEWWGSGVPTHQSSKMQNVWFYLYFQIFLTLSTGSSAWFGSCFL